MKKIILTIPALLFVLITCAQELKFNTFTIPDGHVALGQGMDQWEKVFYYFDNAREEAKIYVVRYDDEDETFEDVEIITLPVAKIKPLKPVFTSLEQPYDSRVNWFDANENDFVGVCEADKESVELNCFNKSYLDVIIASNERAEWLKDELYSRFKN
jgi:hypothetical protein